MKIGLDFDNTIVSYDALFLSQAVEMGLVPPNTPPTKRSVRARVRDDFGDTAWQRLQVAVYGTGILRAEMFPGVKPFFEAANAAGHDIFIVSHKTQFAHIDPAGVDLQKAALQWLEINGFFEKDSPCGIAEERVHFEITRSAKIGRINTLGCDVFVDDLEEVINHRNLSPDVSPILFDPKGESPTITNPRTVICGSWQEVADHVFVN